MEDTTTKQDLVKIIEALLQIHSDGTDTAAVFAERIDIVHLMDVCKRIDDTKSQNSAKETCVVVRMKDGAIFNITVSSLKVS